MAARWLRRNDPVRIALAVAAWAAVSAAPIGFCGPICCSQPLGPSCCEPRCDEAVCDEGAAAGCPACAAEMPKTAPADPCRCLLEGRDTAPAVVDSHTPPQLRAVATALCGGCDLPMPAWASRDRLAIDQGSLLPSRPCRILYGVWRN